jgi:hypothetical protein
MPYQAFIIQILYQAKTLWLLQRIQQAKDIAFIAAVVAATHALSVVRNINFRQAGCIWIATAAT